MRKTVAFKMLFRSPLKTLLTFLLIAAASFTLFSRAAEYAVTSRETEKAESFYHGVAALDLTQPMVTYDNEFGSGSYIPDNKPWPDEEQMEKFCSLPGVTVADHRYMTAGMVEDYRRLIDPDYAIMRNGQFAVEGSFLGCEDTASPPYVNLLLEDVHVLVGDKIVLDEGQPLRVQTRAYGDEEYESIYGGGFAGGERPRSFYDGLKPGSRCLVFGRYNELSGRDLYMQTLDGDNPEAQTFYVIEGLGDDYLETEEFAYPKKVVETYQQNLYTYDIVYTHDMRAVPRLNERDMVISQGRPIVAGDEDACVVSELFLETNQVSIGDRITVKLGDNLRGQNYSRGAVALWTSWASDFVETAELEIVGAYQLTDDYQTRIKEGDWSYTLNTIFVPADLLPVTVPDDYVSDTGEFSVLVEDAYDIEAFRQAAEPMAAEMGVGLRFSDGGWMSIKDTFSRGRQTALLTALLYALGAALTLVFAVYLYVGRNKMQYAVMRTLGVSAKGARNAIVLPFAALSAAAALIGGTAGLFYASGNAAKTLARLESNALKEYTSSARLPFGALLVCLAFELLILLLTAAIFLRQMKRMAPLELLASDVKNARAAARRSTEAVKSGQVFAGADLGKLRLADAAGTVSGRKYGAASHTWFYVLRQMWRRKGKTVISLALAAVLAGGIGALALTRLAYRNAFLETNVNVSATGFASSSVTTLSKSDLIKDAYYYGTMEVCVNQADTPCSMILTNDLDRCLTGEYSVTYADGCDSAALDDDGGVCLVGKPLAESMGIQPGDEIGLLTHDLYKFITTLYEDESEVKEAAALASWKYKVVGVIETENESEGFHLYSVANSTADWLYGQPFPIGYCELTLADNGKVDELNTILEGQKNAGMQYAPVASYYVDTAGLESTRRVRDLLETMFPVAVGAVMLIGMLGSGLMVLQSAEEAALLRILGSSKKRARATLLLEQMLPCTVGVLLAAVILCLSASALFKGSAGTVLLCWLLYLLCCFVGALATAIRITGGRILELLQSRG